MDGVLDEGALAENAAVDLYPLRQGGLDALQFGLDLVGQVRGVRAGLFLNREDDGGRAVHPRVAALGQRTTEPDIRDLAEREGRAALAFHGNDGVAEVVEAVDARQVSNQSLGVGAEKEAAGRVDVRVPGRFLDVVERDVEIAELKGIDQHLILLQLAADDRDLRQAGHGEEPFADGPIGHRAQVHRRDLRIVAR